MFQTFQFELQISLQIILNNIRMHFLTNISTLISVKLLYGNLPGLHDNYAPLREIAVCKHIFKKLDTILLTSAMTVL